jgi:hypothetical protein
LIREIRNSLKFPPGCLTTLPLLALDKFAAFPNPNVLFSSWLSFEQDEIDSHNLRRVATGFGHRLQAQRSAKHEY